MELEEVITHLNKSLPGAELYSDATSVSTDGNTRTDLSTRDVKSASQDKDELSSKAINKFESNEKEKPVVPPRSASSKLALIRAITKFKETENDKSTQDDSKSQLKLDLNSSKLISKTPTNSPTPNEEDKTNLSFNSEDSTKDVTTSTVPKYQDSNVMQIRKVLKPAPFPLHLSHDQLNDQSDVDGQGRPSRMISHQNKRDRVQERMNESLLTAIYYSKPLDEIQKLLEKGADILTRCRESGASVLHVAALNSDSETTEFLLTKGADVNSRDRSGKQAVHIAAWEGALNVLQILCKVSNGMVTSRVKQEKPFNLEHPDSWNHKHEQLNKYWQVMDVITEGSSPLHVACRRTKESCVKFLIESGAKTMEEDAMGLYPMDVIGMNVTEDPTNREASNSSEGSVVGIAKLLIGQEKRISSGTPTMVGQPKSGWLRVRRLFSVDEHDVRPVTALHTAVSDNNLNLISILLDEGADVLVWNENGQTPLHLAVKKKFSDALCLMIRHGDNRERRVVDAVNSNNQTLLHLAVSEEWTDGISILLEENADVTCKTDHRETVLHIVARGGNVKILTELLTVPESSKIINSVDNECNAPIHRAVENNHLSSLELLISNGAKTDLMLPDGRTLLHIVAQNDSLQILECLIKSSPISKMKEYKTVSSDGGMTALHLACVSGSSEIIDILLKFGCDLGAQTSDSIGSTPLHLAAKFDRPEVIEQILKFDEMRTALEAKDNDGWYPLHIAAGHGHEECVDILLRAGADIALVVEDEQGTDFTGLDIIMTCVHKPVDFLVRILDSYIIVDDKVPVTNPQCKIEVDFDFLLPRAEGKQLGVLEAVLNNGSEELEEAIFLHPIVQTFIHLKSKNMFLFFAVFFDLFFLLAFYLSIMAYHGSFTLRQPLYRYILIGLLSINMLAEVINVGRLQRYYFKDTETWIKWCVYLNIMFIAIHPTDGVLRYNMAVSILLSWSELLLLISKYPSWGIYVLMFATVAATVLKVLAVFSLLLIGFAFTFRALFQEQGPFNSAWNSIVKVIIMVFEVDYRGTMEEMKPEGQTFADISKLFYLVFVLMISVSLVNLMIGLAVSDIAELKRKGRARRLAKQVAFLGGLENLLYCWPLGSIGWTRRHRTAPQCLVVKAGSSLGAKGDSPVPRYLKEIIIEKARSVQSCQKTSCVPSKVSNQYGADTTSIATRKSLIDNNLSLTK